MSTTKSIASAPLFYFNGYGIEASYSFSEYNSSVARATKANKVWLDMEFKHPTKEETVTVRSAKSAKLLVQPKEVIEAIAQRDVRNFLCASL